MWNVNILSLFPDLFPGPLGLSVVGNALKNGLWDLKMHNIRDYAYDKHKTVDDTPYGGGGGMVIKAEVLGEAIDKVCVPNGNKIIYLSPRGRVFNQKVALELASLPGLNIICGRFEGIDERIFLEYDVEEISLGDFVVSSGDVAAFPILDACVRLLPGVLDDEKALNQESFGLSEEYSNLLEYPHYTKPAEWRRHRVPDVLLGGHHKEIEKWRYEKAIEKTRSVRPELLDLCRNGGNNESA